MPSSNTPSSQAAISLRPVSANGNWNVPTSSRLYQMVQPSRSQYRIFSRSLRRLQNTSRWPENGLRRMMCWAIIDSPSKLRRISQATVQR